MMIAASVARPEPLARIADVSAPALVLDFNALDDRVKGNAWLVPGVSGNGLELDGIAAHVLVPSVNVPRLSGSFTLEGWVALGAYPFNNAPILQQQRGGGAGFFLGVGDRGQIRFDATVGGRQLRAVSSSTLELRQWAHIVGVFEEGRGITLYVNGKAAGAVPAVGAFDQAADADLWIGRNAEEMEQSAGVGSQRQQPTRILLDGILDELRITPGALSAAEVETSYARLKPSTRAAARRAIAAHAAARPGQVRRVLHPASLLQGVG